MRFSVGPSPRRITIVTAAENAPRIADTWPNRNGSMPGRSTTSTPAKPVSTAIQRRQPTGSLRKITDRIVTKAGIRNSSDIASAIDSRVKAITENTDPATEATARSSHIARLRQRSTSIHCSPGLRTSGSTSSPSVAPRNTSSNGGSAPSSSFTEASLTE